MASALRCPATAGEVAVRAVTCEAGTPLVEALRTMRTSDFSQLPYRHADRWVLVTRDQVARWLELHVDDEGLALVDCSVPVGSLPAHGVDAVVPSVVQGRTPVPEAVDLLETALRTPDAAEGGYAAVLVEPVRRAGAVGLLTADDLPRLHDVLGR